MNSFFTRYVITLLMITFPLVSGTLFAEQKGVRPLLDGAVHEAYITTEMNVLVYQALEFAPPKPLQERTPQQKDDLAEWIPGYWEWSHSENDYIWVSGIWRRPPPGHTWISSEWKKFPEGWARIEGFWSPIKAEALEYIAHAPPDRLDENVTSPPKKDYFWMSGYWAWLSERAQYFWIAGKWEQLNSDWVYVPSRYIWRVEGYVFVPAHWDWTMEERGRVYTAVFIDPSLRTHIFFEPVVKLDPSVVLSNLYLYYPNYLSFFRHHYFYHPNFWLNFCCTPSWWVWNSWWTFTWSDHWSLWWWYCHPGYPQPKWINADIASMIPAPSKELLALFKRNVTPPLIVTHNGVIGIGKLVNGVANVVEGGVPIFPVDPVKKDELISKVQPKMMNASSILQPSGEFREVPVRGLLKPVVATQSDQPIPRLRQVIKPKFPIIPRLHLIDRSQVTKVPRKGLSPPPVYRSPEKPTFKPPQAIDLPDLMPDGGRGKEYPRYKPPGRRRVPQQWPEWIQDSDPARFVPNVKPDNSKERREGENFSY